MQIVDKASQKHCGALSFLLEIAGIDSIVLKDHLVHKIYHCIDKGFIRKEIKD